MYFKFEFFSGHFVIFIFEITNPHVLHADLCASQTSADASSFWEKIGKFNATNSSQYLLLAIEASTSLSVWLTVCRAFSVCESHNTQCVLSNVTADTRSELNYYRTHKYNVIRIYRQSNCIFVDQRTFQRERHCKNIVEHYFVRTLTHNNIMSVAHSAIISFRAERL